MANKDQENDEPTPQDRPFERPSDNPNLDPNPDNDGDLEEGGGVIRGHTPPESQSASASPPHTPSARPPRSKGMMVLIGIIVAIFVFIFVAYGIGIWA